jgi:hypothetical protein
MICLASYIFHHSCFFLLYYEFYMYYFIISYISTFLSLGSFS